MQVLNLDTVKQQLTMPMAIEAIEDLLKVQHENPSWVMFYIWGGAGYFVFK